VARTPDKLRQAEAFGADFTINAAREDLVAKVMEYTKGAGADAAVDYVVSNDTLAQAVGYLRKGGTWVLVGSSQPQITFPVGPVMFKEISLRGSLGMTRQTVLDAVDLVARGVVSPYVTEVHSLDDLNTAAQRLGDGKVLGRSVILF